MKKCRMIGLMAVFIIMALDQLHKWLMLDVVEIDVNGPIEVTPFFNLVMVWNRGISFGMFSGHNGDGALYLSLLAMVISGVLFIWLWRVRDAFVATALGLVIGGALGNVIDRQRFGAVADFFDVHLMGYHWPAFNIADSAIFIGVAMLFWDSLLRQPRRLHSS